MIKVWKDIEDRRTKHLGDGKSWIGVDFDGTLAYNHGWQGWNILGEPIPAMVRRVQIWLEAGHIVKILTARVTPFDTDKFHCKVTNEEFTNQMMITILQEWCLKNIGQSLPVTCMKDLDMIEFWDDRAIQIIPNTGLTLFDPDIAQKTVARNDSI